MKYLILIVSLILSSQSFSHDRDEDHSKVTIETIERSVGIDKDDFPLKTFLKIEHRVFLELARQGDFFAQIGMISLPSLWNVFSDWQKLKWSQSGMYWALKSLDEALERGACVGNILDNIEKFSRGYNNSIGYTKYEKEIKGIKFLEDLKSYRYASEYMVMKLEAYRFPRNFDEYMEIAEGDIKEDISKLTTEEQKKTWELVSEWETKWGDKLYNPKDWDECAEARRIHKKNVIDPKIIEIYLKGDY